MFLAKSKIYYGWIVLLVIFFALLISQGIKFSFGAFIEPWEKEFGISRGTVSFIALYGFIIFGIGQPIVGKCVDRFGIRIVISVSMLLVGFSVIMLYFSSQLWHIFIWFGLANFGFSGASKVAAAVAITKWFVKKRGSVIGLIIAGSSVGQMLIVPLSLYMITIWGWQFTFLIYGFILLLIFFPICWLLVRSKPEDIGTVPYGAEDAALPPSPKTESAAANQEAEKTVHYFKTVPFWFLAIPYFLCGATTAGLIDTHLIPYAHDHGLSTPSTGFVVSVLAAFNIVGTIASGYVADKMDNRKFLGILYAVRFITMIILLFSGNFMLLIIFAVLFGLVDFATIAPTTMLAADYFKQHSPGTVVGYLSLSHQMGSAAGAYIPGVIYDITGGYGTVIAAAAVLLVVAASLSFLLPRPPSLVNRTA